MSDEARGAHQDPFIAMCFWGAFYGMQLLCLKVVMLTAGSVFGAACP